ncbi:MAG: ACT domain-containing protein [Pirellulaceae bacterium]|nr:ACT domain-containing protein [Pirellulaceae bacterium]
MSTFNTDYVLVKDDDLEQAIASLQSAAHNVR